MAQGPYGYQLSDYNVKILQEIEASKTFIYCIKLPGFKCHTTFNQPTHQSQGGHFLQPDLDPDDHDDRDFQYMPQQPVALRLSYSLPEYTMIKVGISTNPARRLHEIMRSIEGFGVAAAETQFKFIRESDSPDDNVENGKKEDNVIFIQKCHSVRKGEFDYELAIRRLISSNQELDKSFQENFAESLDGDRPRSYVAQVGMTEWVLAPMAFIGHIQQCFRKWNWKNRTLMGYMSGDEFYKGLSSEKSIYQSQDPAQVNRFFIPHKVKIEFIPTRFAYDQDILPVAR